jgi:hypothetical protein
MTRRTLVSLPLMLSALAIFGACSDSPVAPPESEMVASLDRVATPSFADTTDFRNMAGQLWVCATGNQVGTDFHYRYTVTNRKTGVVVAKGMQHGLNIGQCALLATVPTNVRGHYAATVKQDAPTTFYLAHGFFNFGMGYPGTPPVSTVDLAKRTMTSALSNDAGVVMSFYNLVRVPN